MMSLPNSTHCFAYNGIIVLDNYLNKKLRYRIFNEFFSFTNTTVPNRVALGKYIVNKNFYPTL